MIYTYPVLSAKDSMNKYEEFAAQYNKDKTKGNQLRGTHKTTMWRLLGTFATAIADRNKSISKEWRSFDTENPRSLKITNPVLAVMVGVDESTIYRYLKRLELAKIITKKAHGAKQPYEIFFNPLILQIADNQNQVSAMIANCKPKHNLVETNRVEKTKLGNQIGRKIEHVSEVGKQSEIGFVENGKHLGGKVEHPSNGIAGCPVVSAVVAGGLPAENNQKSEFSQAFLSYRELIINAIYQLIMGSFFKTMKLSEKREIEVKNIIRRDYFATAQTKANVDSRLAYFEYETKKFLEFMERDGFEIWYSPENFLSKKHVSTSGLKDFNFSTTIKWWAEYCENKRIKQKNIYRKYTQIKPEIKIKKVQKDMEMIAKTKTDEAISRVTKKPQNLEVIYNGLRSYFNDNIPPKIGKPLLDKFVSTFKN